MSQSPVKETSAKEIRDYLSDEIRRAQNDLLPSQWQSLLVGLGDAGEVSVHPCLLALPFHYPATIDELDGLDREHFDFPGQPWEPRWRTIPEFSSLSEILDTIEDDKEYTHTAKRHLQHKVRTLQNACTSLDPSLTIFGIESDIETWWEANTFYISGPPIPSPPPPVSDIQILARLCRHTHSYVGKSRFQIEEGAITAVNFDGADTTDETIDLLRDVPHLSKLLHKLRRLSLLSTLVSDRSLEFLEKELPHVRIRHSHFLGA